MSDQRERRLATVGDVLCVGADFFRVTGVYLGAVGQQSMIGLQSMTQTPGHAGGHGEVVEMLVPIELVPNENLLRPVRSIAVQS